MTATRSRKSSKAHGKAPSRRQSLSVLDGCVMPPDSCDRPELSWSKKVLTYEGRITAPTKLPSSRRKPKKSLLFTTGEKVEIYNEGKDRWIMARVRGKVRRRNGWFYAVRCKHKNLKKHVSSDSLRRTRTYSVSKDKELVNLVGGPQAFHAFYDPSFSSRSQPKSCPGKRQRRPSTIVRAATDLLALHAHVANALSPLGASEDSIRSLANWMEEEDVDIMDSLASSCFSKMKNIDSPSAKFMHTRNGKLRKVVRSPAVSMSSRLSASRRPSSSRLSSSKRSRASPAGSTSASRRRRKSSVCIAV